MRNLLLAALLATSPISLLAETQCGTRLGVLHYLTVHRYSMKTIANTNSCLRIEI